jgi:sporulation protein YlmC with PRC-barrel domain
MLGNIKIVTIAGSHCDQTLTHGGLTPWHDSIRIRYFGMSFCRALLPTVLATAVLLQAHAQTGDSDDFHRYRFTHIQGMSVENHDGEKLGNVKDFIVAPQTEDSKYALVKSRGLIGLRPATKIVPAHLLSNATIKKNVLQLDVSLQAFKNAPSFRKGDLTSLRNPRRAREIAYYYRSARISHVPLKGSVAVRDGISERVGRDSATKTGPGSYQLASQIVGMKVYNLQKEQLGDVSDLLFDLSGEKPPFAIISTKGFLSNKPALAVPMRMLSGVKRMTLDVSRHAIEKAPLLTQKTWARSGFHATPVYLFP